MYFFFPTKMLFINFNVEIKTFYVLQKHLDYFAFFHHDKIGIFIASINFKLNKLKNILKQA